MVLFLLQVHSGGRATAPMVLALPAGGPACSVHRAAATRPRQHAAQLRTPHGLASCLRIARCWERCQNFCSASASYAALQSDYLAPFG